jgi:hypothetical protein
MHTDAEGKLYMETKHADGSRTREMNDTKGNYWKEKLEQNGRVERERGDGKGNKQMESVETDKSWLRGFADTKGNSYTVDSKGTETRMHQEQNGTLFGEHSFKDGSRSRHIFDKQGNSWTENIDKNGSITRTSEKNIAE